MNVDKEYNLFIIGLLLCILTFLLIKFGVLFFPIIIYSLVLYEVSKKLSILKVLVFGFLFGFLYAMVLFYISDIGKEVLYLFSVGIGLFYSSYLLISKLTYKFFLKSYELFYLIFFVLFLWFYKVLFFDIFLRGASFLLNAAPHLTFLFYYIGSSGVIALIMFASLLPYYFYKKNKRYVSIILLGCFLVFFSFSFIYSENLEADSLEHSVTLVQSTFYQNFSDGQMEQAFLTSAYFQNIISNSSTDIVILPETSYITYTLSESNHLKEQFENLSKDRLIVLGALEYLNNSVRNVAYVFYNQTLIGEHLSTNPYISPEEERDHIISNQVKVFSTEYGKFAILICFEALHRESIKLLEESDLDFLVVISNNYFTKSNEGLNTLIWNIQDLAATTGYPIYSVSNNGPTFYVDNYGRIVDRTSHFENDELIIHHDLTSS